MTILEVSETTLDEMVRDGRFPRGVPWTGKERRWKWSDVLWRELHLDLLARLAAEPPPGDDDPPRPAPRRMNPGEPG